MDFGLTEEQKMLRSTVQDFAQRHLKDIAKEDDRSESYRPEVMRELASLGLVAAPFPEEYGGTNLDNVSYAMLVEEVGKVNFSYMASIYMAQLSLVAMTLLEFGSREQKQKYLRALGAGEIIGCFAAVEPNVGSDASAVETTAVLDGDCWVLNGRKTWASNGGVADIALVFARSKPVERGKGLSIFLVEAKTPGFQASEIRGKMGVRAINTAEIGLDDCRIPRENVVGDVGQGLKVAFSAIDRSRFTLAAGCVGIAQACLDASVSYAQQRRQFGRQIGQFQLIQEMIADMVAETEAARYLVYRVGYLRDQGLPSHKESSMAKYFASKTALRAADWAIQIHGGYGYSDEFPVERYYRDARVAPLFAGTNEIQKLIIAQETLGIKGVA